MVKAGLSENHLSIADQQGNWVVMQEMEWRWFDVLVTLTWTILSIGSHQLFTRKFNLLDPKELLKPSHCDFFSHKNSSRTKKTSATCHLTLKVFPGVAPSAEVNCGGHQAQACADCTQVIDFKTNNSALWISRWISHWRYQLSWLQGGQGKGWCNGDCVWSDGQCISGASQTPGVLQRATASKIVSTM